MKNLTNVMKINAIDNDFSLTEYKWRNVRLFLTCFKNAIRKIIDFQKNAAECGLKHREQ